MKDFIDLFFDPGQCKREIDDFGAFLKAKPVLAERAEIQPFFKNRPQLAAFIGTYAPDVGPATRLAYEFSIHGDFAADIAIGNKERGAYCLIELEDGGQDSIFTTVKGKATKEWGRRFEHGFSQLVDWFHSLDDVKNTKKFSAHFGHGHITFQGILIIGRDGSLSESDQSRLRWRTDKVRVDSNYIHCLTFDALFSKLAWRISHYPEAPKLP